MAGDHLPYKVLISEPREDYTLIDSGLGRKYEQYGPYRFIRPEPQAMWEPSLCDWPAHGEFIPASDSEGGGRWHLGKDVPDEGWPLAWDNRVYFTAQCTPFRHLAFFPDMDPVWQWMRGLLSDMDGAEALNLFGYTGVGTLALAQQGTKMVHVDASKKSVAQARANAAMSNMADYPIRWLIEDAGKFAAREVRRGRRYDAILLDPPKFGRGPKGERWELETCLPDLVADCRRLMDARSRCLFLTVYALRMSPIAVGELLQAHFADLPGQIEMGELAVREQSSKRLLPTAIFARWFNPAQ